MSSEDLFIQILNDFINCNKSLLPGESSLSSLVEYAHKHNLEGIIYYQTNIDSLKKYYSGTIYNYLNRKKVLNIIEENLYKQDIDFFIVKGFSVANLYPQPQLRTMGDCDIVVHSKDKSKVHDIMLKLGAVCVNQRKQEWAYFINDMEFEIHDHLFYENIRSTKKILDYFSESWKYVKDNSLDWNYHFVFLLCHLRKHLMCEGVGMRQFIDIALVIKNVDLDWKKIEQDLELLDIQLFFERVLSLLKIWFNIEIPGRKIVVDESFASFVTDKIVHDGVFGYGNEQNKYNRLAYDLGIKGKIKKVFPPYNYMVNLKGYSYLEDKKYLLPFAWFNRFFNLRKKWKIIIKQYLISNKKVDDRMLYLKQWGL